jgi:hypothetical protein
MTSFPRRCGDARPHFFAPTRPAEPAPAQSSAADGSPGLRPYTPAMRRWVCIIALLAGFSAEGYVHSARPRIPVAIERRLDAPSTGLAPTTAWWARS